MFHPVAAAVTERSVHGKPRSTMRPRATRSTSAVVMAAAFEAGLVGVTRTPRSQSGPVGAHSSRQRATDPEVSPSGEPDVFAARPLRTLTLVECHGLAFAKLIEGRLAARRLMKEILVAVAGRDESKPFVTDEPFDRSVHAWHLHSPVMCRADRLRTEDVRSRAAPAVRFHATC